LRHKSNKKSTDEQVNRRIDLQKIIDAAKKKGIPITRKYLISQLKKKGYTIDKSTLYRDRTFLNQNNTFIRDIAESNYSEMMQDIWEKLEWVEEQALLQYDKKWTNSKEIKRQIYDKDEGVVTLHDMILTDELSQPKSAFLNLIKDIQKQKFEFLTSHNVHLSAAMLARKLTLYKNQIAELQNKENLDIPIN